MYAMAMAYMQRHLKHLTTEGRGDCWLLAILAGFEILDPELVARLEPRQCIDICIRRRGAIVQWAADSESNGGFRLLCDMLGISFNGDSDDEDAARNAETMVEKRLKK